MIFPFSFLKSSSAPAPVVTSLNYDQVDTKGGGKTIEVNGANFVSGAVVYLDGSFAVTTTFVSSSKVSFAAPVMSAGAHDIRVRNPDAQYGELLGALEAWSPAVDPACKLFAEQPDYAAGTWTVRVGTNLTGGTPPPASSGAPNFDGTGDLESASALNTLLSTSGGTIAVIASSTNTAAANTSTPYDNASLVANATQGTLGFWFGQIGGNNGFGMHVYDGAYRTVHAPAATATVHTAVGRYNASSLELKVNAGSFIAAGTAPTGAWSGATGAARFGGNWNGARSFRGTAKALVLLNAKCSDTFATKFHKWAQQRHL